MALDAPTRTNLGAYVRSTLGVRGGIAEIGPPPAERLEIFIGVWRTYYWEEKLNLIEDWRFGGCPDDPTQFYCPLDPPDVGDIPDSLGQYRTEPGVYLTWKNFPVDVMDPPGQNVLHTFPPFLCSSNTYWRVGYAELYDGNTRSYFYQDGSLLPPDEPGTPSGVSVMNTCSESYLPFFRDATNLSLRLRAALWNIVEINVTEGYVDLDEEHGLLSQLVVAIEGQPLNDGAYIVQTGLPAFPTRVYLNNLSAETASGILVYPARPVTVTGTYSAVAPSPFGLYAPRAVLTGDVIDEFDAEDQTLRFSGTGPYDGVQAVELLFTGASEQWVTLLGATWQGPASGTWENFATRLITTDTVPPGATIQIQGTLGTYDGSYTNYSIETYGVKLPGVFFAGTDSGSIVLPGIVLQVAGLPPGYDAVGTVTVVVSGTGLYDGTYTGCNATNFGFFAVIGGGELGDVVFQGSATGTYQITTPDVINGGILGVLDDGSTAAFTAATQDKSGTVTAVETRHVRVTVGTHQIEVGWGFTFETGALYSGSALVEAVQATTVDVLYGEFLGTDSGDYSAAPPVN